MKALILKATLIEGISKKVDPNGQPFKISNVSILREFSGFTWDNSNGSGSATGYGLEPTEIELHPDALIQFRDLTYPAYVELETETEYRRNGAVSVVHGVKAIKAA
jgi:hypothetical protein